jgi:hypothetical protein
MVMRYSVCVISLCNIFSVVCMERERPQLPRHEPYPMQYTQQPQYIISVPTTYSTNNHVITAMEHGWEQLHEIEYAPYRSHAIPLQPMYYPQQQQHYASQIVLNTHKSVPSNYERMKKLYDKVAQLFSFEDVTCEKTDEFSVKINACVNACNKAKKYEINEDNLSKFAMQQKEDCASKAAVFFCLLKKYNQTTMIEDGETNIPLIKSSSLAQSLDLVVDMMIKQVYVSQAMESLFMGICGVKITRESFLRELVTWLHANKQGEKENNTFIPLDPEWRKSFLYYAFGIINKHYSVNMIYSVLETIEKAKMYGVLDNERDLGYYALAYKTTLLDTMTMEPVNYFYDSTKGKISLLCSCVEKYNRVRSSKTTPTSCDVSCYNMAKDVHLIVPDALNSNTIAYEEYDQLLKNIDILRESPEPEVQRCVNVLYPL